MTNNIYTEAQTKLEDEVLNTANLKFNIYNEHEDKLYEDMSVDIFRRFHNLLADNKEEMEFSSRFKYKPEYVSYILYNTSSYDYLVLHANELVSKRQFKAETFISGKFLYYSKDVINKITEEMEKYTKEDTKPISTENYLLYTI